MWVKLRTCESHGDYTENTGNGYYGAYQFSVTTWQSLGYTGMPHKASPAQQDEAGRQDDDDPLRSGQVGEPAKEPGEDEVFPGPWLSQRSHRPEQRRRGEQEEDRLGQAIGEDAPMNAQTLPQVKMPNRDGFISDWPPRPRN